MFYLLECKARISFLIHHLKNRGLPYNGIQNSCFCNCCRYLSKEKHTAAINDCTSDFIIGMPIVYFKSDYCGEKFLKLEYSVKITGDHVESKGTTASSIPTDTLLILKHW